MTGYASKETAVEAMRLGAFDYIEKPCKLVEIEAILLKIVERRKLKHKNIALQTRMQAAEGPNRADRRVAGHADGPAAASPPSPRPTRRS